MKEQSNNSSSSKQTQLAGLTKLIMPSILIIAVIIVLYIAKDSTYAGPATPHNELMENIVGYAVLGCELASVIVIVTSAIHGLISYVKRLFNRDYLIQIRSSENIRLRLGHRLSLALEFAMAADILSLAISPRFNELLTLFVIILLRVLITIFLEYDIETSENYQMVPVKNGVILDPSSKGQEEDAK